MDKPFTSNKSKPIKEEVKPIDIKAQADLDRLNDKYKDQKKEQTKEPKPEVIQQIDAQQIEQEVEMLNHIYIQSFKRDLPGAAILSYRMGSLSYQKKHGRSPLELMDKYPMIYFAVFGLAIINDIFQNLPKKNKTRESKEEKTNKPNSEFKTNKTAEGDNLEKEQYKAAKAISATEELN